VFAYPAQSRVDRVVAKARIYAHARASKRLQQLFAAQVGEIVWKYKLAPETVNLPARGGVDEIQVFEVRLRQSEAEASVLQAIDKAVPFPLALEVTDGAHVRFAASYKRRSEAHPAKWVIEGFFETDPCPLDGPRLPLPVALDLASLYDRIVQRHIPLAARADESLSQHVARYTLLEAKRRDQRQLAKRLAAEKQFNRRVELNAQLRSLASELDALQRA
jgi:hypothetical protein